ncbi:DUF2971 domain-containing protein [Mediterraneibacter glycyrrhizinilyticus]|uniref:DUF2971 domain-containing protein n=1 Tax=Mediterraneibacter glycyrrhizinilyticus TaxID=342942 RepID=UPI0025AA6668|nr:DUF2971 domain-containing protein [Mediterraneibacter glycyrrhizinilyticus]MDN0044930.1 DUF2971 domain-containing protein [Mediterraneibacter glycyrrhizinilyticus]
MKENKWKGKKLYHYTGFPVLEGIMNKGELWLCNVKSMNDTKEMLHYMDCLEDSVCKKLSDEQKEKAHNLFDDQLKKLKDKPVYASSFSCLKDDAAQWERYASNGEGICLTFNAEKLEKVCRGHAILQTVFYTKNANKSAHASLIRDYVVTGKVNDIEWGSIEGIFENSWASSSAYKHDSFKSEKEVRVVSLPFSIKYFLGEPRYKIEGWGIREYYILDLNKNEDIPIQDLIKEVTIGPRSKATVDTVQRYLKSLNSNFSKISVSVSNCPLL